MFSLTPGVRSLGYKCYFMKKLLLFYFLTVGFITTIFAGQVPLQDAKRVAVNFYYERVNQYWPTSYSNLSIDKTFIQAEEGIPVYYIFTFPVKGFIIVSASDRIRPVLGYSFDGIYDEKNLPPQFTAWVGQYSRQIRYAIDRKILPAPGIMDEWDHYLTQDPSKLKIFHSERGVSPFTVTKWNQDTWYNEMCPADPGGPGGHTFAGCVPTAIGQIMYYYRWPDHGTGSYSYTDSIYGVLSANFDTTWYQWNNMTNFISSTNPGISRLLYHIGVSCDLKYGPGGSGMYNHKAAYAFRTFFKYSPQTQYVFRDSTNLNWDSLIITHLDRKMPLYYAGWSLPNVNGHAFVCDGYQDTLYFHFNFGWGGNSDGYYYLDNLTPGGNNFNLAQELVINIFPDTSQYTYPPYCSNNTTLKFKEGSMTDGSGPVSNYLPHSSCEWIIDPQTQEDSISFIKLMFDAIKSNPGDMVTVYDGGNTSAPVLGQYSGDTLPPVITSNSNKILLRFTSDMGPCAPGWSATYATGAPIWCEGFKTITADTAVITDGSYGFNYKNNSTCMWQLMPEHQAGKSLTISFRSFDTDPNDSLIFYDLDNTNYPLAKFSGHYDTASLPAPVTSPGGKMFVLFKTNASVTGKGWEFYYPKSNLGIVEKNKPASLTIYPNPASDEINVQFILDKKSPVRMELTALTGEAVWIDDQQCSMGWNKHTIHIPGTYSGIFLLKVSTALTTDIRKILIMR